MEAQSTEPETWPDGGGPLRSDTAPDEGEVFVVDVAGYEGPLDLLLDLARRQKVDLARISVLKLAEQYLAFIGQSRRLRLELAAEYLVMAAWLAYLKSRLLLPDPPATGEPPAEDLAARLQFRLQRLQAMREAGAQLMARNRLGRDVFGRGAPEPLVIDRKTEYADTLVDLLKAYAERRQRRLTHRRYQVRRRTVWSLAEARAILERLVGDMDEWGRLDAWLAAYLAEPESRASVISASLTASLELARDGRLEIRQERAFEPIYMRRRPDRPAAAE